MHVPVCAGRVSALVESSKQYIVHGGETDGDSNFVAPTFLDFGTDFDAFTSSDAMADEVRPSQMHIIYPSGAHC